MAVVENCRVMVVHDQAQLVRVECPLCHSARGAYERTVRGFALEKCLDCGMVFVNPQYRREELERLYQYEEDADKLIDLYARSITPTVVKDLDWLLDKIEKCLPGKGRLLDVGCGPGYFVERAAQRGWDAYGVDFGSWVKKAAAARSVANIFIGSVKEQNFPDGFFDVVSASQVFEHLPAPTKDLEGIRQIIRSGGIFYANVPNYRCLSILLGRDDFELNDPPQHINYFTPASLRTLVERTGFQVLQTSTYGGVKWENLIGRPIRSEIADAYRAGGPEAAGRKKSSYSVPVQVSDVKRLVFPAVKTVLYEWAKVGMCVEVFARR